MQEYCSNVNLCCQGSAEPKGLTWLHLELHYSILFLYLTFALLHLPASSGQAGSSTEELAAGKALQQLWAQFREAAG